MTNDLSNECVSEVRGLKLEMWKTKQKYCLLHRKFWSHCVAYEKLSFRECYLWLNITANCGFLRPFLSKMRIFVINNPHPVLF